MDEPALIDALRTGTIAGAGLDVFDIEPLPLHHPLRSLPNTVLTPHLGYVTSETYRVFYGDAVENIQAFLDGNPVRDHPGSMSQRQPVRYFRPYCPPNTTCDLRKSMSISTPSPGESGTNRSPLRMSSPGSMNAP